MTNLRDFLAAGVELTPETEKLAIRAQAVPQFSRKQLGQLAPHILRALVVLHTGDYPQPYVADHQLINLIVACQDNA